VNKQNELKTKLLPISAQLVQNCGTEMQINSARNRRDLAQELICQEQDRTQVTDLENHFGSF
jgi:hypothetical protein